MRLGISLQAVGILEKMHQALYSCRLTPERDYATTEARHRHVAALTFGTHYITGATVCHLRGASHLPLRTHASASHLPKRIRGSAMMVSIVLGATAQRRDT